MDLSKMNVRFLRCYEAVTPLPDGYTQENKFLPYFSVACPIHGYYLLQVEDGEMQTVPKNGCFLVPPGVRHTLVHRKDEDGFYDRWMYFSVMYQDVLDVTAWFRPPTVLTGEDAAPFLRVLEQTLSMPEDPYAKAFFQLQAAGTLLTQLHRISDFSPAGPQLDRIYPAMALVRKQCSSRLTVEDMAKQCGMSPSAFHRAFRQATGKTPMQFVCDHRLSLAARLLMQGGETLSQIAARCGFCDEFHLSRNFKQAYGISPREYRRSLTR